MKNIPIVILVTSTFFVGCESPYENTYEQRSSLSGMKSTLKYVKQYLDEKHLMSYAWDLKMLKTTLSLYRPKVDNMFDWNQKVIKKLKEAKYKYSKYSRLLNEIAREINDIDDESLEVEKTTVLREVAQARLKMPKINKMFAEIETKISVIEERFAVDKKRHELKKEKYREHLLKGISANGISKNYICADKTVVVYVDSTKVRKDNVTLIIKAYLIKPSRFYDINTSRCDTHISLYNTRGRNLGSPIDSSYSQHHEAKGATLSLTYEDNIELGEGHVKLVIEESVLRNEKEVVMEIAYNLKEITPPELPSKKKDIISPIAVKAEKDFVTKIETIKCKRKGNHLFVPVTLSVHGKEIETEMMLDTGASVTTIPMELYRKGNSKPLSELKKETFQTAKGMIQSYVDNAQISTSAYSKTITVAISNYDNALLGANYFESNIFTVDLENECIYVHPKSE